MHERCRLNFPVSVSKQRPTSLWSVIGQTIYIFILSFILLSFFSSPNLSGRRLDVCHTSTHGVALVRIWDAGLKRAERGSLEMQNAKNRQKVSICTPLDNFVGLYLRNQGTYRQSEKKLLSSNVSARRPHNMVNFSPARVVWWLDHLGAMCSRA